MSPTDLRTRISREELRRAPHRAWNAFVELLASSPYEDLSPPQRVAYLAFWYDAEILDGGHRRYFETHGVERLAETLAALGELGATSQQTVLGDAARLWSARSAAETADALDRLLGALDDRYHAAEPELGELLQAYLDERLTEFVQLVD